MKSVLMKYSLKFYPFNVIFPPYTPDKQKMVRLLSKTLDVPQAKLLKRFIWLVIIIFIIWLFATKRITLKKIKMLKNLIGVAAMMLTTSQK